MKIYPADLKEIFNAIALAANSGLAAPNLKKFL
jgi:hypothetical protein